MSMFETLGQFKKLIKVDRICIDNNVFRLHYKATFIVLLVATTLVVAKQYIGDPIDCIVEGVPGNVMDTYCWIHSTFTVPDKVVSDIGYDSAHPGVGPAATEDELKYHKYYQWVCFTLFFQAILCYIPRYLWKVWEAGKMKCLVLCTCSGSTCDTHTGLIVPIVDAKEKTEKIEKLLNYFQEPRNHNKHNWYAIKFYFCEFLNFVNVIGQIFLMDFFLGGEFTTYGSEVWDMMEQDSSQRTDPMARVFPKMAKCTFHKYGPTGSVQKFDGLCILPVNIINEKIYFFLWFWFIALAIITGIQQLYRLVSLALPGLQHYRMKGLARAIPLHKIQGLSKSTSMGDWFVLCQMGKNMEGIIFRDFVEKLADEMNL